MKSNIKRFITFWLLFSFLFLILNTATSLTEKRLVDFYKLPRNSLDVIFIGNSHNYCAFQPQLIDDIVPINSYIIGGGGDSIILSYNELKEVLLYQHPQLVVLETYTLNLYDKSTTEITYYSFLDSGRWSVNKTTGFIDNVSLDKLYTYFPGLRTRMRWESPQIYIKETVNLTKNLFSSTIDPGMGVDLQTDVISEYEFNIEKRITVDEYPSPSPEILEYLEKIRQLCKENNIQLAFVTVPMVIQPQCTDCGYAPFDSEKYAVEHQIPLITFDPALFNHLHFVDFEHLNSFGSVIVSTQIAEDVARLLDLPINKDALRYYQKFVFSDYSISAENGNYTLLLIPMTTDSRLEYNWSVVEENSGEVVSQEGWVNRNSISFTLPHAGRYEVKVEIREPSGDLVLSANFPVNHEG